jgi:hypothetical protein
MVEVCRVMLKYVSATLDPNLELGVVAQAEQDHSAMRPLLSNDEIAKIVVTRDQDPVLIDRKGEDACVGHPGRILACDPRGIVSVGPEIGKYSGISAFVEQESHADAACATSSPALGPLRRCRWTTARA